MNRTIAALLATLAVVTGCSTGPDTESPAAASPSVASAATPTLTPEPTTPTLNPTQEPSVSLVTHVLTPFGPGGFDLDNPRAASITFRFDAPASWEPDKLGAAIGGNDPPDGAYVGFYPGGGDLFSEPCQPEAEAEAEADVAVGPTVDDLVTALVDHASLNVTDPVDVTLAGYSGKYLDLQVPDDISECFRYRPMDAHIYAQGPGQRWHMWVLDVGGVRVLVETNDFAGTSAQWLAEEQAMIDSLEINP